MSDQQEQPQKREGRPRCPDTLILSALMLGTSVAQAARQAQVSERTVWRRLKDPAFRQRLQQMERQVLAQAARLALGGLIDGVLELRREVREAKTTFWRNSAAKELVKLALSVHDHHVAAGELADLQAVVYAETPEEQEEALRIARGNRTLPGRRSGEMRVGLPGDGDRQAVSGFCPRPVTPGGGVARPSGPSAGPPSGRGAAGA
jgi:hypothetical protein